MESNSKSIVRNNFISSIQEKRKLTYAEKRLIKDLEELEEQVDPTLGISAQPLPNNLMKWHANIRGPEGSAYEGGILHLEFTFPQDYPNSPPKITQVSKFSSPFFSGSKFASEMVEGDWCSGYSTSSLLIQIQCCLFDIQPNTEQKITQEMTATKTFKCTQCPHDMSKGSVWPPFECILEGGPKSYAKLTEEERLIEDTYCFHTRLNVAQTLLGTGVAYSRLARTRQINKVYTTIDNVSLKAFKEGLRKSINKKRFSHWIPLFFGDSDKSQEKTLDHFRKCLSLLATNRSDQFEESLILKIMPYMMLTHAMSVISDKAYSSIKGLRMFLCFHRAFLFLLDAHPNVKVELETRIKNFIESEDYRHKDKTPDLGVLLTLLTVSEQYSFDQIKQAFIFESLDRKVLWTSKKVPALLDIQNKSLDDQRIRESFECNQQSFLLHLFFNFFITQLLERNQGVKNFGEIKQEYDKRYCRLDPKLEDAFQQEVKEIQLINNYEKYFTRLGFPAMKQSKLNDVLKQAVKNSATKKYHGGIEISFPLPETNKRILEIIEQEKLFQVQKQENQVMQQIIGGGEIAHPQEEEEKNDEEFYKQELFGRYPHIAVALAFNPNFKAGEVAFIADTHKKYGIDIYLSLLSNSLTIEENHYIESFKQLIVKLDIERTLYLAQFSTKRELVYQQVLQKISNKNIQSLCITLRCLILNYDVISQLTNLKSLSLILTKDSQNNSEQLIKQMQESQTNGQENQQMKENSLNCPFTLNHLEFINIEPSLLVSLDQNLLQFIKQRDALQTLILHKMEINQENALQLLHLKHLQTFKLLNCQAPQETAKAIGTLLKINAQSLISVDLSNNHFSAKSQSLFENIIQCQKLENINLSSIDFSAISKEESSKYIIGIAKLPNLRQFILNNSKILITHEGFQALAQSQTLTCLEIKDAQNYPGIEEYVGNLLQQKSSQGYPLRKLSLSKFSENQLTTLFQKEIALPKIEEEKQESILNREGFSLEIEESILTEEVIKNKDNLKIFTGYNHLKFKNMKGAVFCGILALRGSKQLQSLEIIKGEQTSNRFKLMLNQLKDHTNTLKLLTLVGLHMAVSEAFQLKEFIRTSNNLLCLNLYGNQFGVEGAKFLSEGFKANGHLKILDLGCNQLKNKGSKVLSLGLFGQESQSKVRLLSIKNNYINEKGFKSFSANIMEKCGPFANKAEFYLQGLQIGGNQVPIFELQHLSKAITDQKIRLCVDGFDRIKNNSDSCLFLSDINKKTNQKEKVESKLQKYIPGIIVKEVKIRKGQKTAKTKQNRDNTFMFIEFDHPNGVAQSLRCAKDLIN